MANDSHNISSLPLYRRIGAKGFGVFRHALVGLPDIIYLVTANVFERFSVPYRLGLAAPLGKRGVEFMYQKPLKR
jgi:hypothetical protein